MKRRAFILLVLLSASCLTYAQNQQRDKKDKLEKEIAILDRQLNDNAKKSRSALNTLTLTRRKISNRQKLLSESEREIRVLNDKLYARQKEINRLQERLDTLTIYYEKLVKNAYKNRDSRIWYMHILASDNLNQAAKRYSYLKNLSTQMNIQAEKLLETKKELETQRAELEQLKKGAVKLKSQHTAELGRLKKDESDSQKLVNELKRNKAKYQKELAAKKRQVEALNNELKKEMKRRSGKPVDTKLSGEFASNKGKLPWPVEGVMVDFYGQHFHPVYKSVKLPFNNGVGIATGANAPVKAVFDGEVRQVIVMPGYNKCVLVQHGEYFTFYCKLGTVKVKAGEKVKTGQTLGNVDTIAGDTQLHFELWKGTVSQNPDNWLR